MSIADILLLLAVIVVGTLAWGGIRGAPWVPTHRGDVPRILALAAPTPGARVADLGCGTGGVLQAFARVGCRVTGWELALVPWLIAWIRLRRFPGSRAVWGDFWHNNFREFDIVYLFLFPKAYARLEEQLRRELRPGARVLTAAWPLPGWTPERVDRASGRITIYLYRVS
ncbi:class I SAM-dependent methyltransferase [Candidatus Uhrbacteria bacterium]|nr:class I SAM-dependent methyltransferase [Candidatus Uhrbacteria bacterium]